MLEEMKVYAKELGIKSVHLYKSEEKLQAKIDELGKTPDTFVKIEDVVVEPVEVVKEVTKKRTWEVQSGKFFLKGVCHKAKTNTARFECDDDYSKVFPIKEV